MQVKQWQWRKYKTDQLLKKSFQTYFKNILLHQIYYFDFIDGHKITLLKFIEINISYIIEN